MAPLAPRSARRADASPKMGETPSRPGRGGRRRENPSASFVLVRPLSSVAWELRACWASGRRVSLSIDGDPARDDQTRAEGFVTAVAATGAYCRVGGLHVPLDRVLAVHRPSRLGDSSYREGEDWRGPVPLAAMRDPRQLELIDSDRRGV